MMMHAAVSGTSSVQVRSELKQLMSDMLGARAPTMRLTTLECVLRCKDHNSSSEAQAEAQVEPVLCAAGDAAASEAAARHGHRHRPAAWQQQQLQQAGGADGPVAMDEDGPSSGTAPAAAAAPASPPPSPSGLERELVLPPRLASPAQAGPGPGSAAAAATGAGGLREADPGTQVLLRTPVLEYLVNGTTELKIGKHLFSGRLTLRPGQDERDEGSLDHAASIAAVSPRHAARERRWAEGCCC